MIAVLLSLACARPEPLTYAIPAGFDGWVDVELSVSGVAVAPLVAGERVVAIGAEGSARTGSGLGSGGIRCVASEGSPLPVLEDQGVGYDEAWTVTRPSPFVCCRTNRSERRAGEAERTFERFYVGRGPALTAARAPPFP